MSNKAEEIKTKSQNLRGSLEQSLKNPITGALATDDQTLIKFHGIYQQDDRDIRESRIVKKLEPLYSFMIRLRIAGGKITAKQWIDSNKVADQNSTGIIKITTRQTIQLHGVVKSKLKPTVSLFGKTGLDSIAACGDVNRNVMSSVAIAKSNSHDEVYEFSKKISDYFLPKTNAYHEIWLDKERISSETEEETIYGKTYLPRKFKIVVAIPPSNDVDVYAHDIGLIAIIKNDQLQGYNVSIGGGMGMTHGNEKTFPRVGDIIGFVNKEDILQVVEQIIILQRDFGNREDRKLSRFKYTVDKYGADWCKNKLESAAKIKFEEARNFSFSGRGDKYGWETDYLGNSHYLQFVENGRVLDDGDKKLKTAMLEIAEKNYANFRFTNNQNVIFSDIKLENKTKIEEILKKYNINNNGISKLRGNAIACVAFNTCPLALAEGQRYMPELITKIDEVLEKHKLLEEEIYIRMTGCPNGCARPYMAEIGLVGKSYGKYNLYLGGDPSGRRLNKLYKENLDEKAILNELDELLSKFKQERKLDESFGDFTLRI
ncbi:NADPH-dependent assimilatory sulfite reductase hemoprotein subunit [Flavobacteriaceae bacterium]|nr:NADPH-dependent assimilatory sulfite reductase hemoprotein subunit [Flavobacteriaceae bacterium]